MFALSEDESYSACPILGFLPSGQSPEVMQSWPPSETS